MHGTIKAKQTYAFLSNEIISISGYLTNTICQVLRNRGWFWGQGKHLGLESLYSQSLLGDIDENEQSIQGFDTPNFDVILNLMQCHCYVMYIFLCRPLIPFMGISHFKEEVMSQELDTAVTHCYRNIGQCIYINKNIFDINMPLFSNSLYSVSIFPPWQLVLSLSNKLTFQ